MADRWPRSSAFSVVLLSRQEAVPDLISAVLRSGINLFELKWGASLTAKIGCHESLSGDRFSDS